MKKILYMALMASTLAGVPLLMNSCSKGAVQPDWAVPTATQPQSPTATFTKTNTPLPTASATPTSTWTPGGPTATFTDSPTITYTPTPAGFTFNSAGAVSPWIINTGAGTAAVNNASTVIYNPSFAGCSPTTGAMEVTAGFAGVNQALFIQDTLPSPVNMSGQSVSVILDVTGGWNSDSEQLYAAIYVSQGNTAGSRTAWASLYQGGLGLWSSSSTSTSSNCVTLSITLPSGTTNTNGSNYNIYGGPIDPTQIQVLGIQFGTGSSGTGFAPTVMDVKSWLY